MGAGPGHPLRNADCSGARYRFRIAARFEEDIRLLKPRPLLPRLIGRQPRILRHPVKYGLRVGLRACIGDERADLVGDARNVARRLGASHDRFAQARHYARAALRGREIQGKAGGSFADVGRHRGRRVLPVCDAMGAAC